MPGIEGCTLQCLESLVTMISNFYGRNFMELDGEIEMETLHEGNPKADLPLIVSLPPDIMLRFTCLRLSDECTHSEAPCSPSPARKSSVPFREFNSDDCDSMDIDSQYDVVYRVLLEDIVEKLAALELYTAADLVENCN